LTSSILRGLLLKVSGIHCPFQVEIQRGAETRQRKKESLKEKQVAQRIGDSVEAERKKRGIGN
jgi:hypothetical protein